VFLVPSLTLVPFQYRERYSLTMEQTWTAARLSWEILQALEGSQAAAMAMEQASEWTLLSGP